MSRTIARPERKRPTHRRAAENRKAAAVVEFAVLLPIMIVLVFGSIEVANGIFLKQALAVSAYEGARAAARTAATDNDVRTRISEVLTSRGIKNETVTISPVLTSVTRGTTITVTVTVPRTELGTAIPLNFLKSKNFTRSVSMVRQ